MGTGRARHEAMNQIGAPMFEVLDVGDLTAARLLEPLALLWIHLALRGSLGTGWAWGVLRTAD